MLQVLFLLVPAASLTCGSVTCAPLTGPICATRQPNGYQLNSLSCPTGLQCSVSEVLAWWASGQGGDSLACSTGSAPANVTSTVCPQRQTSRSFKGGKSVLFCTKDTDCELEDGTFTVCLCALRTDGQGVCQPDPSSALYWEYWDDCGDGLELSDSKEAAYWAQYMAVWAWTQTDNVCASNLTELKTLDEKYRLLVSGAQTLLLAFLWT